MLDLAFVEEIIPVLITESTHPNVKGITAEVIRQLGLRGRSAAVAERRIRPMVIEALKEHYGDEELDEDILGDDDVDDEDDDDYYSDDVDDEDDDDYYDDDEEYPGYGDEDEDFEDEDDELDGYSYDDEDDDDR